MFGPMAGTSAARRGGGSRVGDAHFGEQAAELVFDHIGERADDKQLFGRGCGRSGALRDERREARVLALGEARLDAAARIVEHARVAGVLGIESCGGLGQIELDDFGRAGADEEEQLDFGAAGQQAIDDAVELLVAVRHAGEIALLDDRGGESGFGEDHHPCGGL